MERQRLEWHLENWRDYMRRPSSKLGYPSRSMVVASGGDSAVDVFEEMCESADATSAMTMDAMIDSLKTPQRVAIYHQWLKTNHYYPTQEYDYDEAISSLAKMADKRGLV